MIKLEREKKEQRENEVLLELLQKAGAYNIQIQGYKNLQKQYDDKLKINKKDNTLAAEQKIQKTKEIIQEKDMKSKEMLGIETYRKFIKARVLQKQIELLE